LAYSEYFISIGIESTEATLSFLELECLEIKSGIFEMMFETYGEMMLHETASSMVSIFVTARG
jgi:hypothetical protein